MPRLQATAVSDFCTARSWNWAPRDGLLLNAWVGEARRRPAPAYQLFRLACLWIGRALRAPPGF